MDISYMLMDGEQILYQGEPTINKGGKKISGEIGVTIAMFLVLALMFLLAGDKTLEFYVIIVLILIFPALCIYSIAYKLFLKNKMIVGKKYFLTNQRAIVYSSQKDEYTIGYIANYEEIKTLNVKNNYGDLYMGIILPEDVDNSVAIDAIRNKNKLNSTSIMFESIENVNKVYKMALEIKHSLVNNKL
jgi:hypothetical protein